MEPDEVRSVCLGVVKSGVGTGDQSFAVLTHLKTYLMINGAGIFFPILKLAKDHTITTCQLETTTLALMARSFNYFNFMGDLGLHFLNDLGTRYIETLSSVKNKDEFIKLMTAVVIYINLLHHWIHTIFSWHLGNLFSHHTETEVTNEPKLAFYKKPSPL